jgi:hypothetical protein
VPLSILTLVPTTTQLLELGQATPSRESGVPVVWLRQVLPPFVLRRSVPLIGNPCIMSPTATQMLGLTQATPRKLLGVPLIGLF